MGLWETGLFYEQLGEICKYVCLHIYAYADGRRQVSCSHSKQYAAKGFKVITLYFFNLFQSVEILSF